MKYETFVEKFSELSTSEKVAIFNEYCLEYGDSDNLESVSEYDVEDEIDGYLEEIFEHEKTWEDYIEDDEDEGEESAYVCPECGHVFVQGEWDYNYDTALLDFKCPECDWEGNEHDIEDAKE